MSERSSRPHQSPGTVSPLDEPATRSETDAKQSPAADVDLDLETLTDGDTTTILTRDDVGAHIRRLVIETLTATNTPLTIDEVVDRVVDDSDADDELVTWSSLHERLYSVELPILDANGVLEFDSRRGIVDVRVGSRTG